MLSKRSTLGALALPLLAALCCGPVRAAELGEVKVNSFLGQQLSADIELVDLTASDLAEIQARLANPDVFKGAGLNVPPVLGGLYISVAKRDNRRFLHLTTLQPVNNEALHLFLELSSGGRQIIRAATLWLTPEPPAQRAARTAAAQAATPAAAPMPALAAAASPALPVPAAPGATPAAQAASPVPSAPPAAAPGTSLAPSTGAKRAAEPGDAGLNLAAQRAFAARKQAAARTTAEPARIEGNSVTAAAAPAPKPAARTVRPPAVAPSKELAAGPDTLAAAANSVAACMPAQVEAQIQQCQAMTGKLVDLEGKVQRLQQALAPATAPALAPPSASMAKAGAVPAPGPAPVAAAPATAAAAPTKPGAKPGKPGVSAELEAKSRTSTIMMAAAGAVILAALGGLLYFLRKRKGQGPLKIWQSFRKKEEPAVAEPVMEEVTAQE